MALQSDLIISGEYVAIPKWLAASQALPASAKLVWAVLANRLGENTTAWPHQTTIAEDTGLSVDCVGDSILLLRVGGLVSLRQTQRGNVYTLLKPVDADWEEAVFEVTNRRPRKGSKRNGKR